MQDFKENLFVLLVESAVEGFVESLDYRLLLVLYGGSDVSQIVDKEFHGSESEVILLSLHKLDG